MSVAVVETGGMGGWQIFIRHLGCACRTLSKHLSP